MSHASRRHAPAQRLPDAFLQRASPLEVPELGRVSLTGSRVNRLVSAEGRLRSCSSFGEPNASKNLPGIRWLLRMCATMVACNTHGPMHSVRTVLRKQAHTHTHHVRKRVNAHVAQPALCAPTSSLAKVTGTCNAKRPLASTHPTHPTPQGGFIAYAAQLKGAPQLARLAQTGVSCQEGHRACCQLCKSFTIIASHQCNMVGS